LKKILAIILLLSLGFASNIWAKESGFIGKEKTVEARGEVGCSNTMSMNACKSGALAEAKRRASEQAATTIKSETKVADFAVQSDEVSSMTYGVVKSYKVLSKGMIGDGVGYFYEIQAVVQAKHRDPKDIKKKNECSGKGANYLSQAQSTFKVRKKLMLLKYAAKYCPTYPEPYIALGQLFMDKQSEDDHAKALSYFKTALRIDPKNKVATESIQLLLHLSVSSHTQRKKHLSFDDFME